MSAGALQLCTGELSVSVAFGEPGALELIPGGADRGYRFGLRHPFIVCGGRGGARSVESFSPAEAVRTEESSGHIRCLSESGTLRATCELELRGSVLTMTTFITNESAETVYIKDFYPFVADTDSPLEGMEADCALDSPNTMGERTDYLSVKKPKAPNALPLFSPKGLFLGIDWAAAENLHRDEWAACREPVGLAIAPGQRWRSRPLSIGVAAGGNAHAAFGRHIKSRGCACDDRVSFYFDWMTHGSEGPDEKEMALHVRFFETLGREMGLRFDVFSADDGVFETQRHYEPDYRVCREARFPGGIEQFTDRLKSFGTDFGIWIGPDGFGDTDKGEQRRIETVIGLIRTCNVRLIKLDTVVSSPFGSDPYQNAKALRKLERLCAACRRVRPDIVIVNHRLSFSPYILLVVDSILWGSRESYIDHLLANTDKPRLFSRQAAFGRKAPIHFGVYQHALEDHGVCASGEPEGILDELALQMFGRALRLSPELYGALFLLPDSVLRQVARLMALYKECSGLFHNSRYLESCGAFVHGDASHAAVCFCNDSWEEAAVQVSLAEDLGLAEGAVYTVRQLFPFGDEARDGESPRDTVTLRIESFGVVVLELEKRAAADHDAVTNRAPANRLSVPVSGSLAHGTARAASTGIPEPSARPTSIRLAPFERTAPVERDVELIEKIRFLASSDPREYQIIKSAPPSAFEEANSLRELFAAKIKRLSGAVADSARDDDPLTSWSVPDPVLRSQPGLTLRLDLGEVRPVRRVALYPSRYGADLFGGESYAPVIDDKVSVGVSENLRDWQTFDAVPVNRKWGPGGARYTEVMSAELPERPVRFVQVRGCRFPIGDIRVIPELPAAGRADRRSWRGSNRFTLRPPVAIFTHRVTVHEEWVGSHLACIAEIDDDRAFPLNQEVAFSWLETDEGLWRPSTEGSPPLPFNGWVRNPWRHVWVSGRSFVYRFRITEELAGRSVRVRLAWIGPGLDRTGPLATAILPSRVYGYVVGHAGG